MRSPREWYSRSALAMMTRMDMAVVKIMMMMMMMMMMMAIVGQDKKCLCPDWQTRSRPRNDQASLWIC